MAQAININLHLRATLPFGDKRIIRVVVITYSITITITLAQPVNIAYPIITKPVIVITSLLLITIISSPIIIVVIIIIIIIIPSRLSFLFATQEPQPALYDPVLNITYPLNLTNPDTIPDNDPDPIYYPEPIANLSTPAANAFIKNIVAQVSEIIEGTSIVGNCSKCIASLSVAKSAALLVPESVPDAMVQLCKKYKFYSNATCEEKFQATTFGAVWTQVLAFADVGGSDGHYICNSLSRTFCPAPTTQPLNMTGLFPKPKPANATAPRPSGKRVKVVHLSDFHLDPRYAAG
ncbi:hypothetical protein B0A49_06375, partial [Cryomyces minteri]